jgi:cation:H+ antiporter
VVLIAAVTVAALGLGVYLMGDGELSRRDALLLALTWLAATTATWLFHGREPDAPPAEDAVGDADRRPVVVHLAIALGALAVVGAAATGLVSAVVELSETLGLPAYLVSFFGASLGTSMPELAVQLVALRRGQAALALGDVLGACLVDSSLSIAAGPLLFPVAVSAGMARDGAILAIVIMTAVALLLGISGRHRRPQGALLIALYAAGFAVMSLGMPWR